MYQLFDLETSILNEIGRAFIGDTPEEINQYKDGLFRHIVSNGESLNFEDTVEESIKYRRSKAPDKILDWHKINAIKSKQESKIKNII